MYARVIDKHNGQYTFKFLSTPEFVTFTLGSGVKFFHDIKKDDICFFEIKDNEIESIRMVNNALCYKCRLSSITKLEEDYYQAIFETKDNKAISCNINTFMKNKYASHAAQKQPFIIYKINNSMFVDY